MYLIHARLGIPAGRELPHEAASVITSCARPGEGLEHLVVHPVPRGGAVVGLFVAAPDLARAEAVAWSICRRALRVPRLSGVTLLSCASPLVTAYYERLLAAEPPVGRDRPRPESS